MNGEKLPAKKKKARPLLAPPPTAVINVLPLDTDKDDEGTTQILQIHNYVGPGKNDIIDETVKKSGAQQSDKDELVVEDVEPPSSSIAITNKQNLK